MHSGTFKAVCYKCSYEGQEGQTRCPVCQFPVILEPEKSPPGGFRLEDILARKSVHEGAPPLPGVHAEKRQAQLNSERRRERRTSDQAARRSTELPLPAPPQVALPQPMPSSRRPRSVTRGGTVLPTGGVARVKLGLLCASAIAAGIIAAALQSGL